RRAHRPCAERGPDNARRPRAAGDGARLPLRASEPSAARRPHRARDEDPSARQPNPRPPPGGRRLRRGRHPRLRKAGRRGRRSHRALPRVKYRSIAMCELLGMECNVPTDIVFSFTGLRNRGGRTAPHSDGWGLAFYEGRATRVFLDPSPAAESALARFLSDNPIKTLLAIGHIRKRTRGPTTLANTHPFVRELWGRHWVFAHNGTLRGVRRHKLGRYRPIGNT